MNESEAIVILMTAGSSEEATRIAELLVSRKLAACVQILPGMRSIYLWKGEVHRDDEVLLLVKTTRTNFETLEHEVRAIHSYETPEIIALPIIAGSENYLDWLCTSCEAS
jgi:periplasmic divalent cation tolerance protein